MILSVSTGQLKFQSFATATARYVSSCFRLPICRRLDCKLQNIVGKPSVLVARTEGFLSAVIEAIPRKL